MTKAQDQGMALVAVLIVMTVLLAIGLGVVTITATDVAIGGAARRDVALRSAADAASARALHDLATMPSWTPALQGTVQSSFSGGPLVQAIDATRTVNLAAMTMTLQAESDGYVRLGANNPRWRLFAWGWLHEATGDVPEAGLPYVAVWVFDDWAETDTDPEADSNGRVGLRAVAFGPSGGERAIDLVVAQITNPVGLKVIAWRSMQ